MVIKAVFCDDIVNKGGAARSTLELVGRIREWIDARVVVAHGGAEWLAAIARQRQVDMCVLRPKHRPIVVGKAGGWLARTLRMALVVPRIWALQRRLRRVVDEIRPDLIWTNTTRMLLVIKGAVRGRPIRTGFFCRQAFAPGTVSGWARKLLREEVDGFFCLSSRIADSLVELGVSRDRISIVPNCIEPEKVQALAGPLAEPLPRMDAPVRMLLPGSLVPRKGACCAVRALGRIVRAGHDAVLYLSGDTIADDPSGYVDRVKEAVEEEGITDRVFFLGWRDDLPKVIAASTAVILPSNDEGTPRVLLEAMALKRPVVATPVGGVPDLVEHGRTGWLHAVDDEAGMAEGILAAHDPTQREQVVEAAYRHIREHFSPERQVELAVAAFQRVAAALRR